MSKIYGLFIQNDLSTESINNVGKLGEILACVELKSRGYEIIEKNFRTKYGEIDIIAVIDKTICFIEVKARSSNSYGAPEEFVTKSKQLKLWRAASIFINNNVLKYDDYRFDVASVDLANKMTTIFVNAFEPGN